MTDFERICNMQYKSSIKQNEHVNMVTNILDYPSVLNDEVYLNHLSGDDKTRDREKLRVTTKSGLVLLSDPLNSMIGPKNSNWSDLNYSNLVGCFLQKPGHYTFTKYQMICLATC